MTTSQLPDSLADKVDGGEIQLVLRRHGEQRELVQPRRPSRRSAPRGTRSTTRTCATSWCRTSSTARSAATSSSTARVSARITPRTSPRAIRTSSAAPSASPASTTSTRSSTATGTTTCYFNCPTAYIPNMDGEWVGKLSRVDWVIATGEHDTIVRQEPRVLGAALVERDPEPPGDLGRRLRPRLAVVARESAPVPLTGFLAGNIAFACLPTELTSSTFQRTQFASPGEPYASIRGCRRRSGHCCRRLGAIGPRFAVSCGAGGRDGDRHSVAVGTGERIHRRIRRASGGGERRREDGHRLPGHVHAFPQ